MEGAWLPLDSLFQYLGDLLVERFLLVPPAKLSFINICLLPLVQLRSARLHLLDELVPAVGTSLLCPPRAVSSPGWTSPAPSATLPRASAAAPWSWPSSELSLSCFWWPKTEHSTQMWLNKYWVNGDNHFPSPADCSPLTAARDIAGSCPACGPPSPLGPFLRAAPHHSVSSLGSLHRVFPSQVQDLAFVLGIIL